MNEEERRIVSYMKWACTGQRAAERCGAGTEDHDRAKNHGSAWICDADAGRREVL